MEIQHLPNPIMCFLDWFKIDLIVWKFGSTSPNVSIEFRFKIDLIVWKYIEVES